MFQGAARPHGNQITKIYINTLRGAGGRREGCDGLALLRPRRCGGRPRAGNLPANRGDRWQPNSLAARRASQDADGAGTAAQTFFLDIGGKFPV